MKEKTIEERAEKSYVRYVVDENNNPTSVYIPTYIKGATEQKAIDDAHLADIVKQWKEEELAWIEQEQTIKREMIEKAWRFFEALLEKDNEINLCPWIIADVEVDFRKAMEE